MKRTPLNVGPLERVRILENALAKSQRQRNALRAEVRELTRSLVYTEAERDSLRGLCDFAGRASSRPKRRTQRRRRSR